METPHEQPRHASPATCSKIPKVRTLEFRGGSTDIVSLWLEVPSGERRDRFTVEIFCPRGQERAKAMRKDVLAEVTGVLRHDRWKDKATGRWIGKVFVAIDPAEGKVKSLGMADADGAPPELHDAAPRHAKRRHPTNTLHFTGDEHHVFETDLRASDLLHFTGSECWYRHPLYPSITYTDGAQYVAEAGGAYWLWMPSSRTSTTRACARKNSRSGYLKVAEERSAVLTCEDGDLAIA